MRVAHFVQRYPPAVGGSEAYFARLSRYLAGQGDQVTVFTTAALDLEAFWRSDARCLPAGTSWEDGVEIRRYGLVRWPGRRWFLKPLSVIPHRFWQCLTLPCNPISPRMWADAGLASERFDVVHATAFPYAWPIACGLRLARRLGVPFLVTPFLHLGDPEDPRDATRRAYTSPAFLYLLRAADRIFVQTDPEYEALRAHGLPANRLVLQGLGVDPGECTGGNRQAVRARWGATSDEVAVGHLANLSAEKGTVDLLRAAELAWQQGQCFTLVLAGPAMLNFRNFWKSYPFADRVRCLGVLTEEQKRDFFSGIDLFALPSRSDSFGLVLLEAWANELANLAYRAGGVAGVIRHEEDGLLVRCGDIRALAEALGRLVGDALLRRRLGTAGQERLADGFRWNDKLGLVRHVYDAALNRASEKKATVCQSNKSEVYSD
jgi:glycosyltransferase involved in cell wall biosynthesis